MLSVILFESVLILPGCGRKGDNTPQALIGLKLPEELQDCKMFEIYNPYGYNLTLARCPLSATTTVSKTGKISQTTIVVDGIKYVPEKE